MISTNPTDWENDQPIETNPDLSLWNWVSTIYEERFFFYNKKKLKDKKNNINESLTKTRMEVLKKAQEELGFLNVWSPDGRIMYKNSSNEVAVLYI